MKFPEQFRFECAGRWASKAGDPFGAFTIPAHKAPGRRTLNIIASDGYATQWEHVSVCLGVNSKTLPTWSEMCFVKDLFWDQTEWVVQFHPAKKNYLNFHPGVLYLWKPVAVEFPKPSILCV